MFQISTACSPMYTPSSSVINGASSGRFFNRILCDRLPGGNTISTQIHHGYRRVFKYVERAFVLSRILCCWARSVERVVNLEPVIVGLDMQTRWATVRS